MFHSQTQRPDRGRQNGAAMVIAVLPCPLACARAAKLAQES